MLFVEGQIRLIHCKIKIEGTECYAKYKFNYIWFRIPLYYRRRLMIFQLQEFTKLFMREIVSLLGKTVLF